MRSTYLDCLNPAQLQAVTHDPGLPLQILAGPGSGKTKVLTSRIAHLISHHRLRPSSICAVTFTNKAANEMRERLTKLVGKGRTDSIKMGTFHALCAKFLRKYHSLVGLEGNFTVCDADESKKIVKKILASHKKMLDKYEVALQEGTFLSKISKAKAKGLKPADLLAELKLPQGKKASTKGKERAIEEGRQDFVDRVTAEIYRDYQRQLTENNSLDFDDLLVFGVRLFRDHPKIGKWCKHVLVDEFQDTNTMQYELMLYIAAAHRCVTIVGDPDQSIYGWRSAEVQNLRNMTEAFPGTVQIFLEQNYRSTGSILAASVAVVSQDKGRIQKTLRSTHQSGPRPFLCQIPMEESKFVAAEIKRLVAYSGGMLNWNDFVVLLRYSSLSRQFEKAFMNETVPYRVLAGHKFFERAEVKDVLAYLQMIDNPQYLPAFNRCINVPSRSIGEKTVSEILSRASSLNISPMETLERIHDGKIPDIKPPVKRKITSFIKTIRELTKLAHDGTLPAILIGRLLELIEFREYLTKTQPDAESRWDNVQELINFAAECAIHDMSNGSTTPTKGVDRAERSNEPDDFEKDQSDDGEYQVETPLRIFLQITMLSTDTETQNDDKKKEAVTISTCHAAKGLEWPVVFIPAVEKGVFPSSRAEDIQEERRLLYVACTRAQGLLYLTHNKTRMIGGEVKGTEMSEFVKTIGNVFTTELPKLDPDERKVLATVWQRVLPEEGEVKKRVENYNRDCSHPLWEVNQRPRSYDHFTDRPGPWAPEDKVPLTTGFTSARESLQHQMTNTSGRAYPSRIPLSPSKTTVMNSAICNPQNSKQGKPSSHLSKGSRPENVASASHATLGSQARPIGIDELSSSPPYAYVSQTSSTSGKRKPPVSPSCHTPGFSASESNTESSGWRAAPVLSAIHFAFKTTTSGASTLGLLPVHPGPGPTRSEGPVAATTVPGVGPTVPRAGTGKKRLGMGRTTVGYPNKKFKRPT